MVVVGVPAEKPKRMAQNGLKATMKSVGDM